MIRKRQHTILSPKTWAQTVTLGADGPSHRGGRATR